MLLREKQPIKTVAINIHTRSKKSATAVCPCKCTGYPGHLTYFDYYL
jgi:hypothetical protein